MCNKTTYLESIKSSFTPMPLTLFCPIVSLLNTSGVRECIVCGAVCPSPHCEDGGKGRGTQREWEGLLEGSSSRDDLNQFVSDDSLALSVVLQR